MPVVTDLTPGLLGRFDLFYQRLRNKALEQPYWYVSIENPLSSYGVDITARCPHGVDNHWYVSFMTITESAIDVNFIADNTWHQLVDMCAIMHNDLPHAAAWIEAYDEIGSDFMSWPTEEYTDYLAQFSNILAANTAPYSGTRDKLEKLIPNLRTMTDCPAGTPCCRGYLSTIVIHLNDSHYWPRPKIADWLESLDVDLTIKKGA